MFKYYNELVENENKTMNYAVEILKVHFKYKLAELKLIKQQRPSPGRLEKRKLLEKQIKDLVTAIEALSLKHTYPK